MEPKTWKCLERCFFPLNWGDFFGFHVSFAGCFFKISFINFFEHGQCTGLWVNGVYQSMVQKIQQLMEFAFF